jgi:hypothetical protein
MVVKSVGGVGVCHLVVVQLACVARLAFLLRWLVIWVAFIFILYLTALCAFYRLAV